MLTRSFIFGALGLFVVGCQNNPLAINSDRQPILGGAAATVGQFPSVVALLVGQGNNTGLCTGTLIAPNAILTAAHCIDPGLSGLPSLQAVADNTLVIFNSTNINTNQGFVRGASQVIQHPSSPNFPAGLGQHDIGVIILDSPVNNIAPSPVEFDPNRNLLGVSVVEVGYGETEQGTAGALRFVSNSIDNCASFGENNSALVCIDQTDGKGACSGDSGGPLFGPAGEILGVTSFGDRDCEIFGAYTRASFEADFVAQFVEGGTPPDCSANNQCNPACIAVADPDCLDCDAGDNQCTAGCGQNGNPEDIDCNSPLCGADNACNQQCIALNQVDPDCTANNAEGEGCSITPAQPNSSPVMPVAALFALFGLGLIFSRRR
jgi:MYXO-CTERM domain-containing protein